MLTYLVSFLLLLAALDNLTNQREVKGEQTKQLASYLKGFIPPPVTLINTSTSAKKVTFTQTRAHKYLSARTQMDDIFQGSSLYATAQMPFLHDDKETRLLLLAVGVWLDPPSLPFRGKNWGYVIKTHIQRLYKWNRESRATAAHCDPKGTVIYRRFCTCELLKSPGLQRRSSHTEFALNVSMITSHAS